MKYLKCALLALSIASVLVPAHAATNAHVSVFEDFRANPLTNNWRIFGNTNLFAWNATNQNLEVTWDSSKSNSYFYRPLARPLTRADGFELYFDLRMRDIAIGTTTNKPYTFQVAVGLLNFRQATNGAFLRGTGFDSPNLFEFDYFPDSGFGATISPTVISSNSEFATAFILQEITTNDLFRVLMRMDQEAQQIVLNIQRNGEFYAARTFSFPTNFTDFSVDTVAISSYSDAGQLPDFAGSILAHGTVDEIVVSTGPLRLNVNFTGRFENGNWRVDFDTFPGWFYIVERTSDFNTWSFVEFYDSTNYGRVSIVHSNPPAFEPQFYRVGGERF